MIHCNIQCSFYLPKAYKTSVFLLLFFFQKKKSNENVINLIIIIIIISVLAVLTVTDIFLKSICAKKK